MKTVKLQKFMHPVVVVFLAAAMRLVPHLPNVAPITAMALFGGVYLNKKYALVLPLLAMVVSDIFLGFHDTMIFVYGSFFLIGGIGLWLRNHRQLKTIFLATLFSSLLFFLITNFGVWLMGTMYAKTFAGLLTCYWYGLPFLRNTVLGDLLYTGALFGGYEALRQLSFPFSKTKTA